jgi:hypothetical protein
MLEPYDLDMPELEPPYDRAALKELPPTLPPDLAASAGLAFNACMWRTIASRRGHWLSPSN